MDDNKITEETKNEPQVNNDTIIDNLPKKEETPPLPREQVNSDWVKKKMTICINEDTIADIHKLCPSTVTNISQFLKWMIATINDDTNGNTQKTSIDEQELVRLRNEKMELKKEVKELEEDKPSNNGGKLNSIEGLQVVQTQPAATQTTQTTKVPNNFMELLGF